jgi:hypothetical protein
MRRTKAKRDLVALIAPGLGGGGQARQGGEIALEITQSDLVQGLAHGGQETLELMGVSLLGW